MTTAANLKTIDSIHITARRWYSKTYGNTYHSVKVYVNDDVLKCNFAYGSGDQFLQTASELLIAAGYDLKLKDNDFLNTFHLREVLRGTYRVVDVNRKSELAFM